MSIAKRATPGSGCITTPTFFYNLYVCPASPSFRCPYICICCHTARLCPCRRLTDSKLPWICHFRPARPAGMVTRRACVNISLVHAFDG